MKRALALALFVIICFFLITLEMKNPESIFVQYYFGIEYSLPMFILIVIPFLAGLLFGVLFMSLSLFKNKRSLGKTKKDLVKAEQEVQNLRSAPIKDEV
jgi:putative membrane protein